jgi:hypothetical protein
MTTSVVDKLIWPLGRGPVNLFARHTASTLSRGKSIMPKLRLDLEMLAVESFDTVDSESEKGTVLAHATGTCTGDADYTCVEVTCFAENTCARSCGLCGSYNCSVVDSCDPMCDPGYTFAGYQTCDFSCNETCTC